MNANQLPFTFEFIVIFEALFCSVGRNNRFTRLMQNKLLHLPFYTKHSTVQRPISFTLGQSQLHTDNIMCLW